MRKSHIHILGICGTFMGSLAVIAKQLGFKVTGSDQGVYPPMSDQLRALGIELIQGYDAAQLKPIPDVVIIGNALSRGNEAVEAVLQQGIPYVSGSQWLAENVLLNHHVLAVAGTHGKTTTTTMLAWVLEKAGLNPGFLIGGVPRVFDVSARVTESQFFVIEADEYDTAFFDKRPKFIHYHPRTLIMNNLEFDHADIYENLAAIQKQFSYLLRTVPNDGLVIAPDNDDNLKSVITKGCWTPASYLGKDWLLEAKTETYEQFEVHYQNKKVAEITWPLLGEHNAMNALAAIVAAHHVGVKPSIVADALSDFKAPKRRMEIIVEHNNLTVYDDFAHHPTAIAASLKALRAKVGKEKIIAIVELGSNTMQLGVHAPELAQALATADEVIYLERQKVSQIASFLLAVSEPCHALLMSNRDLAGLRQLLVSS